MKNNLHSLLACIAKELILTQVSYTLQATAQLRMNAFLINGTSEIIGAPVNGFQDGDLILMKIASQETLARSQQIATTTRATS